MDMTDKISVVHEIQHRITNSPNTIWSLLSNSRDSTRIRNFPNLILRIYLYCNISTTSLCTKFLLLAGAICFSERRIIEKFWYRLLFSSVKLKKKVFSTSPVRKADGIKTLQEFWSENQIQDLAFLPSGKIKYLTRYWFVE